MFNNLVLLLSCIYVGIWCLPIDDNHQPRIVGGSVVGSGQIPWQVILKQRIDTIANNKDPTLVVCGGVLIAPSWVLTAAHCVIDKVGQYPLTAELGVHRLSMSHPTTDIVRSVVRVIKPDKDDYATLLASIREDRSPADLALLKLNQSVSHDVRITPIELPSSDQILFEGRLARVSGFGSTSVFSNGPRLSTLLHAVDVPIISKEECLHHFRNTFEDPDKVMEHVQPNNVLCAGLMPQGGRDACVGDSGGGLAVCEDDTTQLDQCERWTLAGIVSFGFQCAQPNIPGLYTNVAAYVSWMRHEMSIEDECVFHS